MNARQSACVICAILAWLKRNHSIGKNKNGRWHLHRCIDVRFSVCCLFFFCFVPLCLPAQQKQWKIIRIGNDCAYVHSVAVESRTAIKLFESIKCLIDAKSSCARCATGHNRFIQYSLSIGWINVINKWPRKKSAPLKIYSIIRKRWNTTSIIRNE